MTTTKKPSGVVSREISPNEIINKLLAALTRTGSDHSSVKLTRNAKGDTQIEVSVRTDDDECATVEQAMVRARSIYDQLAEAYPMKNGGGKDGGQ